MASYNRTHLDTQKQPKQVQYEYGRSTKYDPYCTCTFDTSDIPTSQEESTKPAETLDKTSSKLLDKTSIEPYDKTSSEPLDKTSIEPYNKTSNITLDGKYPDILRNVGFDFRASCTSFDIVTDIVVYHRNSTTHKPSQITAPFVNTIEWGTTDDTKDFGVVNFGDNWLGFPGSKIDPSTITTCNKNLTFYYKGLYVDNSFREYLAKDKNILMKPVAIAAYPRRYLKKGDEEFNCIKFNDDTQTLKVTIDGNTIVVFSKTGLKAYKMLGENYFRFTSGRLGQTSKYPGSARGRSRITTINVEESKVVAITHTY